MTPISPTVYRVLSDPYSEIMTGNTKHGNVHPALAFVIVEMWHHAPSNEEVLPTAAERG